MTKSNHRLTRAVMIGVVFCCLFATIFAQDIVYVPLDKEGQAGVIYDAEKNRGIIFDYGGAKDGEVRLAKEMNLFKEKMIEELVLQCSHPHDDHVKGITDYFKAVIAGTEELPPTLKKIRVIDNGMPKASQLANLVQTALKRYPQIELTRISAGEKNAFAENSKPTDQVYIETVPYPFTNTSASSHGRAIITLVTLNGKYRHLDTDDAETNAVRAAVETLKAQGISQIDSFTAPHHGSAYHDVAPIFDLKPKTAIFTVNAQNRYGHPAAPILLECVKRLGAENTVFTGSANPLVISSNGIKGAHHTAAQRDSFAFFIQPNMERLQKQKAKASPAAMATIDKALAMYGQVAEIAMQDPGDSPPPLGAPRSPNDDPPSPFSSPSDGNSMLKERILATGSILSPEFDFGSVSISQKDAVSSIRDGRIFAAREGASTTVMFEVPTEETKDTEIESIQRAKRDASLSGKSPNKVDVLAVTRSGFPVVLSKPDLTDFQMPVPRGGMVYLSGGRLIPIGSTTNLIGGTLDLCGQKPCIRVGDSTTAYSLPFGMDALFSDVWSKVVDENVPSFYLSINPTKRMINSLDTDIKRIPTDKLRTENDQIDKSLYLNEVVTHGDIANSRIGQILWESDVMFKSQSLGFNVMTGTSASEAKVPTDLTRFPDSSKEDPVEMFLNAAVPSQDRWCRLYWASGDQQISINGQGNIVFNGNAVIARSEPMRLVNGELEDYPQGKWCREPKSVAATLQRQANLPSGTNRTLKDLRRLAEMQNFIVWAKNNEIVASEAFKQEVARMHSSVRYQIPKWTSGIRTQRLPPFVQLEENYQGSIFPSIHFANPSPGTMSCIKGLWDDQYNTFPLYGLHKEDKRGWQSPDSGVGDAFIDGWMRDLVRKISSQCGARILETIPSKSKTPATGRSFGLIPHTMYEPIEIHGGVILGVQAGFFENALKNGLLLSPSQKIVFQKDNKDLHFWATQEDVKSGPGLEHVVVKDGELTNISVPSGGMLRFEIKSKPYSLIRHELRSKRTNVFTKGVEWFEARSDENKIIYEKASWPCGSTTDKRNSTCIGVADLSSTTLFKSYMNGGDSNFPLIATRRVKNGWVVEIDISSFAKIFDQQSEAEQTSEAQLALMLKYAKWGFRIKAMEKYEQLLSKEDYVDTIIKKILDNNSHY
ncbi:MAG: hypothetical protein ABI999_09400 [Acidobacteriota bacterium]